MLIDIDKIKVAVRIRKELGDISSFADDIKQNGLLQPIVIMPLDGENGEEYQLLAGLRRLKAIQSLGWTEIAANIVSVSDANEALRIEISENEQRKPFTFSEKAYFGQLLTNVEKAKSLERKSIGGQGGFKEDSDDSRYLPENKGNTTDKIGAVLGVSGRTYERIRYVAENAPPEVIEQLDNGVGVYGVYNQLRAVEKAAHPAAPFTPPTLPKPIKPPKLSDKEKEKCAMAALSPKEREIIERNNAFTAMTPDEKIIELQSQLKTERRRAVTAETELERLKVELQNAIFHRDGIINSLKQQLAAYEKEEIHAN